MYIQHPRKHMKMRKYAKIEKVWKNISLFAGHVKKPKDSWKSSKL